MEEEEFDAPQNSAGNKRKYVALGIIIIIIIAAAIFVLPEFNFPNVPGFSDDATKVLVIGQLSLGERVVIDNLNTEFVYMEKTASDLEKASVEELKEYGIIILDQSLTEKSVSIGLGDALQEYVENWGKIIIVKNSAIYQSSGLGDFVAGDTVGWEATLGDISPAECILLSGNEPSCKEENLEAVVGRIHRQELDHPIMEGIEIAPPESEAPYQLMVLPILASDGADTIAYLKSEGTPKTYPAILEKKNFPFGKVIYFNYDPGTTPTIFKNTLMYLK